MNSNPLQRLNNMSISLTEEGFPLGFIGSIPAGKHTHTNKHTLTHTDNAITYACLYLSCAEGHMPVHL